MIREEKRMKKRKEKKEKRKEKGDEIRESPTYVRSDLEEMKVPQLKKIAQEIQLPRYTCGVKEELIDALMEFYEGRDAENLHPKNKQIYKQDYGARKREPVIFREYLNMLKRKPEDFYDFKQNQVLPEQLQTIEKYRQYIKNNFSVEWKALQIVEEYARAVSTGEEKTKPPPPSPPPPSPKSPSPKSPPPKKQKKTDAEKKADKKKYDKARNDAKKARINAIHARLKKEEAENKQMGDEDKDATNKKKSKERKKEREAMGNEDTDAPTRFLSKKEQDALETSVDNKYKKLNVKLGFGTFGKYNKLTVKEAREKDKELDPEKRISVWLEKAMIRKLKKLNDGKIPRNWTTAHQMWWGWHKIDWNDYWIPGPEEPVESESSSDDEDLTAREQERRKRWAKVKRKRGSGIPKNEVRLDKLLGYD